MKILGVIPARFQSSRFPGKPLIDILGKSMIQRVYDQCLKSKCLTKVIIATDDQRIMDHVTTFGGNVVMTSDNHLSGTDRCAEVVENSKTHFDICINIQGDEPFIDPKQIDSICESFSIPGSQIEIATLVKICNSNEIANPNKVKVVIKSNGDALYFSRSPIPYLANPKNSNQVFYQHLGIYGFKVKTLREIVKIPPSNLEKTESLEQLRWLENNFSIHTITTSYDPISIDTPEDLTKALNYLKTNG